MKEIIFTNDITVRRIQQAGGDHMIVAAAKVSTTGEDAEKFSKTETTDSNYGLINYLMAHRHGTPFEHASITFFVHAPIFVWREWHRHRIGFSYNEESGRYKQLDPVFWIPRDSRKIIQVDDYKPARPEFKAGTEEQHSYLTTSLKQVYAHAYDTYEDLVNKRYAKEICRVCLPFAIYSSCWVTCNPRSLMSFLSLRTHEEAWSPEDKTGAKFVSYPQAEIEEAARITEKFLQEGWPLTYKAFLNNGRVGP